MSPSCGEEEVIQTKAIPQQITPLNDYRRLTAVGGHLVQRQVEEEEEETLQAKETSGQSPEVTSNLESSVNALLGGGQPLSQSVRTFFEPRFGYDFSNVRLHTDLNAGETSNAINARAFTIGRDVVFGTGQYSPGAESGKRLLAHELTHVVQQGEVLRPYRKRTAFNFDKNDEDSFDIKKDKKKKPWIELITVKFTSTKADADGNRYWEGTASVQYYNNPAKLPDFSFPVSGGSAGSAKLDKTDKGSFTVHRIEGIGYNSGLFSGTAGVNYDISEREGPRKRYSKDLQGNMSYAVFYNKGEALHAGPLDYSSHGCVHVDWTDDTNIKQLNYHSVVELTKVKVKY